MTGIKGTAAAALQIIADYCRLLQRSCGIIHLLWRLHSKPRWQLVWRVISADEEITAQSEPMFVTWLSLFLCLISPFHPRGRLWQVRAAASWPLPRAAVHVRLGTSLIRSHAFSPLTVCCGASVIIRQSAVFTLKHFTNHFTQRERRTGLTVTMRRSRQSLRCFVPASLNSHWLI